MPRKMSCVQIVEMKANVTNNSLLLQNYSHTDGHARKTAVYKSFRLSTFRSMRMETAYRGRKSTYSWIPISGWFQLIYQSEALPRPGLPEVIGQVSLAGNATVGVSKRLLCYDRVEVGVAHQRCYSEQRFAQLAD